MIKRVSFILLPFLLMLTGCFNNSNLQSGEQVVQQKGKKDEKVIITGNVKSDDRYYSTVYPFEPGGARGLIRYGVDNRLDINELETGLMRLAQDKFSPDKYVWQEGQFLSETTVNNWLMRSDDKTDPDNSTKMDQQGLNPALGLGKNASVSQQLAQQNSKPKYLSYVLEHNYYVSQGSNKIKLGGVVIGLSFNSTYYYEAKDSNGLIYPGQVKLNEQIIKEEAKKDADEVARRLRMDHRLDNVPIMIAMYQEADHDSITPGNFFARCVVKVGDNSISDFEQLDEKYVLFPSSQATGNGRDDSDKFTQFQDLVQHYFPNYVGVVGRGFYKDGKLERLTIQVPVQFRGEAEIIAFTQFIAAKAMLELPDVPTEIDISSATNQPEALIVKDGTSKQPFVHIYRN